MGAYGTPFNRIISAGVSKGPLVCVFHLRVSWMDEKADDDDVVIGVAMGQGVEIGAELVLSSR